VVIMEDIAQGERVREYVVEGREAGGAWQPLCKGSAIGHKRIERFEPVEVGRLRLRVAKAVARPCIRRLAAYRSTDAS
jgi:alpha-L-fucosidase